MARTGALLGGASIFTAYLFLSTALGQTSSPSPSTSPTPAASASASFSNGAGIAVAVIVAIVIIGILICCFFCPQARRSCLNPSLPRPPATAYFPLSSGAVPPWLSFAPDTAVRWILARDGPPPADVVPFAFGVGEDGQPEFVARTRLGDGSLRPGRVARSAQFAQGCRVACEWSPGPAESLLALGTLTLHPQTRLMTSARAPTRSCLDPRRGSICGSCTGRQ